MSRTSRSVAGLLAATVLAVVAGLALVGAGQAAIRSTPANTAPPTISGTPTVGQTLTASNGTWSNSPTSFGYEWLRCDAAGGKCGTIKKATQSTYLLAGADASHTIRVRVTATNADGSSSAESAPTAVVLASASPAAPKNTTAPTISGSAKVGQELTASAGSWSGKPTFAYQWQRCDLDGAVCTAVVGATGTTYGVRIADLGFRLRVAVTAKNAKGSATAPSALTVVVAPTTPPKNGRPTLAIISTRFVGATTYARFRVCDDSNKNLTIIETDSRTGKLSYTRHFTILVPPRPCGVYTRHWTPVARFRGPGRFTVTLRARDKSGLTSLPARRSFNRG